MLPVMCRRIRALKHFITLRGNCCRAVVFRTDCRIWDLGKQRGTVCFVTDVSNVFVSALVNWIWFVDFLMVESRQTKDASCVHLHPLRLDQKVFCLHKFCFRDSLSSFYESRKIIKLKIIWQYLVGFLQL